MPFFLSLLCLFYWVANFVIELPQFSLEAPSRSAGGKRQSVKWLVPESSITAQGSWCFWHFLVHEALALVWAFCPHLLPQSTVWRTGWQPPWWQSPALCTWGVAWMVFTRPFPSLTQMSQWVYFGVLTFSSECVSWLPILCLILSQPAPQFWYSHTHQQQDGRMSGEY